MLVSHRHRFIYLKTKKTAGTSIEMALEPYACPAGSDTAWSHAQPMAVSEAGIVGARGKGSRGQLWYSHMPAKRVRKQLEKTVWQSYTKICAVRNPWDKVVSFFHMRHPRVKGRPRDEIIALFRRWVAETDNLGEDLDIYSINGRAVADEIIRYERLEADFARVCSVIGIPVTPLSVIKGETRGEDRERIDYRDYYDDAARALVAERFAPDIAIIGWTFD